MQVFRQLFYLLNSALVRLLEILHRLLVLILVFFKQLSRVFFYLVKIPVNSFLRERVCRVTGVAEYQFELVAHQRVLRLKETSERAVVNYQRNNTGDDKKKRYYYHTYLEVQPPESVFVFFLHALTSLKDGAMPLIKHIYQPLYQNTFSVLLSSADIVLMINSSDSLKLLVTQSEIIATQPCARYEHI